MITKTPTIYICLTIAVLLAGSATKGAIAVSKPAAIPPVDSIYPIPFSVPPLSKIYPKTEDPLLQYLDPPGNELSHRGREIRGVYVPISKITSMTNAKLVSWIKRISANAVVIDIKDDRGRVTFTDGSGKWPYISKRLTKQIQQTVAQLKQEGIYVIGRLVCFKDNQYPRSHKSDSVLDKRSGNIWRDHAGMHWIDPYSEQAWDYITSIARAAQDTGFDEIQLDYVRFPVEPNTKYALFPNRKDTKERYKAIKALLAKVDHAIELPLSIDVFGLTAYNKGDSDGLGQSLEQLAPHLDAITPMLYLANWPSSVWENPKPSRVYALVHNAVLNIKKRLGGDIAVRPLLQGFAYRADNFSADFLKNQINAATNAGSSGYLFWNQSGHYSKLATVWSDLSNRKILSSN